MDETKDVLVAPTFTVLVFRQQNRKFLTATRSVEARESLAHSLAHSLAGCFGLVLGKTAHILDEHEQMGWDATHFVNRRKCQSLAFLVGGEDDTGRETHHRHLLLWRAAIDRDGGQVLDQLFERGWVSGSSQNCARNFSCDLSR